MEKTTTKQDFTAREEKIITKIIEILATEKYFDSQSELYSINEKTLKGFFPKTASLKTIADVTSKSSLFNYEAGNIALAQTIPALITYTAQGVSNLKINGEEADPEGETIPTKLVLPHYRFEIAVTAPTTEAPWSFTATEIEIPYGKPRKMSPPTTQGKGPDVLLVGTIEKK
ncbi:hypothetical protein [Flavobacterium foetidum]|uniref:hypothetical protein n=1 Tax=Flavobacterium foetidum TaxID=2026681 RepID=UPI00107524B7|nr:hypothetical protein [Flavobacterium foetidum]KAF2515279.1 hypothetical protein E0W73_10100 [Flavobacterium foetidum]